MSEELQQRAKRGPGSIEHLPPIVTWFCTGAGAAVTGTVSHSSGERVGVWSEFVGRRTITTGDPNANPRCTLGELDVPVPGTVLA